MTYLMFKGRISEKGVITPTRISVSGPSRYRTQEELKREIDRLPGLPPGLSFQWEDESDEETVEAQKSGTGRSYFAYDPSWKEKRDSKSFEADEGGDE